MKVTQLIHYFNHLFLFFFVSVSFLLSSCTDDTNSNNASIYKPEFTSTPPKNKNTEYIFGVHPLHNPQRLQEVFGPLMNYLSDNIPSAQFKLEA